MRVMAQVLRYLRIRFAKLKDELKERLCRVVGDGPIKGLLSTEEIKRAEICTVRTYQILNEILINDDDNKDLDCSSIEIRSIVVAIVG